LPWSDFVVARGRALAAFGRGGRDAALMAELSRLRDEGTHLGFLIALPAIEAACAEVTPFHKRHPATATKVPGRSIE
jgi:hypothetical protein